MDDGDPGPPSRAPSLPVGDSTALPRRASRAPLLPVAGAALTEPLLPRDEEASSTARPVTPAPVMPDPYAAADAVPAAAAAANAAPTDPYASSAAPPPVSKPPKHAPSSSNGARSDDERRAAAVTELERLRDVARTFEKAHDDFYEGLAGIGALLGLGIFFATWVTGLTGLGTVLQAKDNPTFNLVITVAGLVGGALSTVQRVWGPAVRATHYRSARDAYAKLKKRAKAALDDRDTASVAALESAVKSVEAKLDDLYDTAPDVPVSRDGFVSAGGRVMYGTLLGVGAFFYPFAVCCAPADPKKPADRRRGGDDGV